jgi:single-strand DNA-binding protein
MRSINKVILIGNLTRDPEMRETPNGQSVTTFGIATNRAWTSNGEQKSSAEFHECVAWAKLAEICSNYLKKGNLIYVEGYLKTRNWEAEDGTKKFKTEVVVQDMIILEKRQSREEQSETSDNLEDEGYEEPENSAKAEAPEEEPTEEKAEEKEEPVAEETPAAEEAPVEETPAAEEAPAAEEEKTEENPIDKDLGL